MNQYRCETCKNDKCIWNYNNSNAYSGCFPKRRLTFAAAWANNFMSRVGCASHSDFRDARNNGLNEAIRLIELIIDAEQEKGEDGCYSLDGHIKLGILAHVNNSIKKLREGK
jgi:hypothetical protein